MMRIFPTSRASSIWRNIIRVKARSMLPNFATIPLRFIQNVLIMPEAAVSSLRIRSLSSVWMRKGNIVLGDEMLTPDSSRFWAADIYEPGHSQPSFDKQYARDWLKANPDSNWTLPEDVVQKVIDKYLQSYEMLTGKKLQ